MRVKIVLAAAAILAISVAAVFAFTVNKEKISVKLAGGEPEDKIIVIATLFPQYDFARQIAGDRAEITLLLAPGEESHTYEPTPADVVRISQSRVFLYTGDNMEPWVRKISNSFEKRKPLLVDVSHGIELSPSETPHVHGDSHEHSHDHHHDHSHEHEHAHEAIDPHIWTDPNNAIVMTRNVLAALVAVDPKNQSYYSANAKKYIEQLVSLDNDIKETLRSAKQRQIVIGGKNAMRYFLKRYGLTAHAAFDSCSAEQEPSVRTMAELKHLIAKRDTKVVYFEELETPRVAQALIEGTDAKLLPLHSAHNLSKADFDSGKTYISLMRQNLENLKEGLLIQ